MRNILRDVLEASFLILSLIIGIVSVFIIFGGNIYLAIFNPWWLLLFIISIPSELLILRILGEIMELIKRI